MLERRTKIVATLGPATDPPGVLDRAGRGRAGLRAAELLARRRTTTCAGARADVRAAAERAGPRRSACCSTSRARSCGSRRRHRARAVVPGDVVTFVDDGDSSAPDRVVGRLRRASRALVTERSQIVIGDGVPRFAVERVDGGEVVARAVSPGPLSARKGINVTYARPELPAITEKDVADLDARRASSAPTSSRSRSCARRPTSSSCATLLRELGSRARADRQDREGRGLRAPRRDHRGHRRRDGRARRLRRRGRRRARAADAEGHDPPRDPGRASS